MARRIRVLTRHDGKKEYPWDAMAVGDFFELRADDECPRCRQQHISTCALWYAKKRAPGVRFKVTRIEAVIRCARVA
jgi:hypothetical protein